MATETTTIRREYEQSAAALKDQDLHSKLLMEAMPTFESVTGGTEKRAENNIQRSHAANQLSASDLKNATEQVHAHKNADGLPALSIAEQDMSDRLALPWQKGEDGQRKLHMSYQTQLDAIVRLHEGPFQVASRLLGSEAPDADVRAFSKALIQQYKEETQDKSVKSLRNGHSLLTEDNIDQVINKIGDSSIRQRIVDRLKEGWTELEPPVAVQFPPEAHGRPGETYPSRIDDPQQFLKDITAAMERVKADEYRARGLCAAGFRLAINQLPLWRIDGGTVDRSINKDIRGWRSGVQMALDLAKTGLFDVVPLKELGYGNLKQGYIVGRWHYPDYVKQRPSWEGEDFGDIDVWTRRHKPPQDHPSMYRDSFVLIPKGLLKK